MNTERKGSIAIGILTGALVLGTFYWAYRGGPNPSVDPNDLKTGNEDGNAAESFSSTEGGGSNNIIPPSDSPDGWACSELQLGDWPLKNLRTLGWAPGYSGKFQLRGVDGVVISEFENWREFPTVYPEQAVCLQSGVVYQSVP